MELLSVPKTLTIVLLLPLQKVIEKANMCENEIFLK